MSKGDRVLNLVGPYKDIYNKLMSYDPKWKPPPIGSEEEDNVEYDMHEWSLEGPAGTGKTFGECVILEALHSKYPNIRTVVIRKTRSSLTNSFMQVLEDNVLGAGHPVLARQLNRKNRTEYIWWNGGTRSETQLAGMDANNLARLYSTQYDVAFLVEAIEFTEDEYESIYRAMRNPGVEFKAIICDTNPGNPQHFLNCRPEKENSMMRRVKTKHYHNPLYFNPVTKKWTGLGRQYIGKILDQYTGVRRKRMLEGVWCSAQGAVYPHFDPDVHVFDPGEPTDENKWGANCKEYDYFVAGIDFGWHDCKCLQVWGVTKDREADMLAEWYGTEVRRDTMAEWVVAAHDEFDFVRCVADHEPEDISFLNEALGWRGGRNKGSLIQNAQKGKGSIKSGCELVMDLMGDPEHDKPTKIRYSSKASRYKCPILEDKSRPMGVVDEIPGYVWEDPKPGKPQRDRPDPGCVDHGCDTERYILTEIWMTDFRSAEPLMPAEIAFSPKALSTMTDREHDEYVEMYAD